MADGQDGARLDSWKEIAAYLKRDVTTVRRWEKQEGLPVHRHLHRKLGSVYAYRQEIDAWWDGRRTRLAAPEAPPDETEAAVFAEATASARRRPWVRPVLAGLVVAAVAGAGLSSLNPRKSPLREVPPFRIAVAPPPGAIVSSFALAPDGEQVVFAAATPGRDDELWIKRLDSVDAQALPGTGGAAFPFWSPDSQSVGFFANGKLKRVALSTREVREIAGAPDGHGGTWSANGTILFAPDREAALVSVPAAGGSITARTRLGRPGVGGHAWPEFLPDGQHFLYLDYTHDRDQYGIHVGNLATNTNKRLLAVYSSPGYLADGFLVYQADTLKAQPFDLDRLELQGDAVTIGGEVLQHGLKAEFSTSASGLLVVRTRGVDRQRLVWLDRTGRQVQVFGNTGEYSNPTLSPDGRRAVVTSTEADWSTNLWSFGLEAGTYERLTFTNRIDYAPVWSPDADRIIFMSTRSGRARLYERRLSGGALDTPLLTPARVLAPESWSRVGDVVTLSALESDTKFDVWVWSPASGEASPLLDGEYNEGQSQISPDGRFIAYVSDESGRFEVYVQSFPDLGRKWQVSAAGGFDPRWRADGNELFYIAADRWMTVVDVRTAPTFSAGISRALFRTHLDELWQDTRNHYDVSPDGAKFFMARPETDPRAAPFTMVINRRAGALTGGQ